MVSYRRIRPDRVKKWAIGIGLTGIPIIAMLFLFMASPEIGAINITAYSGDSICGVDNAELNSTKLCYAYVNFTALTDIYIYPNESWYFYTDIPIKSLKLQRSWGPSWRTIDLNKTWSVKVKYAVKFSKGNDYQIRYAAEKVSPFDKIKWSVESFNQTIKDGVVSYIDPYWLPPVEPRTLVSRVYNANGYVDTYSDRSKTINSGHKTYLKYDGTYDSMDNLDFLDGNWTYLVTDYGGWYKIQFDNKSFRLPHRNWIDYDFWLYEIKETLNIPSLVSLVDRSVVHNATVRYIPLDFSPSIAHSLAGNMLEIGKFRTGDFWIRDNSSYTNENGTFANYSYYDVDNHYQLRVVNGEIRLYFDDLTWFQNAVYPLIIDPTWITNSTTGWNGVFDNTIKVEATGRIELKQMVDDYSAYWRGDEDSGSTVHDENATCDGTITGGVTFNTTAGKYGNALDFNHGYVSISDHTNIESTGSQSLCFWAYPRDISAISCFLYKGVETGYWNYYSNSTRVKFQSKISDTSEYVHDIAYSQNTWTHYCKVFNSAADMYLYKNGVLIDTESVGTTHSTNNDNLEFGRYFGGAYPDWNFTGMLDEIKFYERVLTASEVNQTKDNEHYLIGNYTSLSYDCGDGNIAKNISVHFFNSSTNTKMNIHINMSIDNSSWDNSYILVQAGALNATEYDIASGERYLKYRTELNSTTGAETDEMYEVRVECVSAADTTAPSWDELPTNQAAEYGTAFEIEFNATDATTPPVVYAINDTGNFAFGSSSGILTNNTYLAIGVYYLQLNASDSVSPANINSTDITVTVSDTTDPTVTWYNQTNSTGDEVDIGIDTRRLLNLTWNLTDASSINISSCSIQVRINDTTMNTTDWLYENDTLSSHLDADGWWTHSCVLAYNNSDNTSISVYAELPNTLYYRATSLAIPIDDILDNVTYTIYRDNIAMFKNSNATIQANYDYVTKHYLDSKAGTKADARLWYCNKTYADDGWGDFRISPYCIIAALIPENETKEGGSNYFERYGSADENATFGGIKITDPSYFITDSVDASSATLGWELTGTSGHSGHSYTSDDYGVTWTLETDMEFDQIIQWLNAMYFEARVNITDNEGNTIIDLQTDYFDTVNRAPEAALIKDCDVGGFLTVYNECNISESGTLNISSDFLDPDGNLVNCTFILLNNDSTYNQTLSEIETNASYGVCCFQYDTTVLTNNDYYFKVNVTDGLLIGSDTIYDFVRIDNTDTNFEMWNGSAWIDAYEEYMNFRCTPTQTYCEPTNQNSGQSIYKVTNNGTGSGTRIEMKVNESSPAGMTLFCNTSTYMINITDVYQQIYGAIAQSASVNIWCYMNYSNPTSGWFADTYAKVEY